MQTDLGHIACSIKYTILFVEVNPCPAEPRCVLPLKKPTDLDLHCLPLSIGIYPNNLDQAV